MPTRGKYFWYDCVSINDDLKSFAHLRTSPGGSSLHWDSMTLGLCLEWCWLMRNKSQRAMERMTSLVASLHCAAETQAIHENAVPVYFRGEDLNTIHQHVVGLPDVRFAKHLSAIGAGMNLRFDAMTGAAWVENDAEVRNLFMQLFAGGVFVLTLADTQSSQRHMIGFASAQADTYMFLPELGEVYTSAYEGPNLLSANLGNLRLANAAFDVAEPYSVHVSGWQPPPGNVAV